MTNSSGSLLDGVTLRVRLEEQGPLSLEEASVMVDQIAHILDADPERGLPYGTVSPESIVLLKDGTVRLVPIHLAEVDPAEEKAARKTKRRRTLTGYLSPEEARQESPGPTTDIWSLGALLYESLTGKTPFPAKEPDRLSQQVLHETPEPLPTLIAFAQPVVDRALAKSAEERYHSGQELANALWESLPHPVPDKAQFARQVGGGMERGRIKLIEAVDRSLRLVPNVPNVPETPHSPRLRHFFKRFHRDNIYKRAD